MPIEQKDFEELLAQHFPQAEIHVEDYAGDKDHYNISIRSEIFAGKSRIEQHRIVQEALKGKDIHAVSIKTST